MSPGISQISHGSDLWHADKLGGQFSREDRQRSKFLLRFQIGRATTLIFSLGFSFFTAFQTPARRGELAC